jgi:hypothetical protein
VGDTIEIERNGRSVNLAVTQVILHAGRVGMSDASHITTITVLVHEDISTELSIEDLESVPLKMIPVRHEMPITERRIAVDRD